MEKNTRVLFWNLMTFGGCIMSLGRGIGTRGGALPTAGIVLALNAIIIRSGPFIFLLMIPLLTSAGFPFFGIMCTSVRLTYNMIL